MAKGCRDLGVDQRFHEVRPCIECIQIYGPLQMREILSDRAGNLVGLSGS